MTVAERTNIDDAIDILCQGISANQRHSVGKGIAKHVMAYLMLQRRLDTRSLTLEQWHGYLGNTGSWVSLWWAGEELKEKGVW